MTAKEEETRQREELGQNRSYVEEGVLKGGEGGVSSGGGLSSKGGGVSSLEGESNE